MKKALVVVVVVICGLLIWFGCQKKPADQMETPAVTEQAKEEAPAPAPAAEEAAPAPAAEQPAAPAEGTTGSGN